MNANRDNQTTEACDQTLRLAVAGEDLVFREVVARSELLNGQQIAEAAGYGAGPLLVVWMQMSSGEMEEVRPTEALDTKSLQGVRFIVLASDRFYRFVVDGSAYTWGRPSITVNELRKLARVPTDRVLLQKMRHKEDQELEEASTIELNDQGLETLKTRVRQWALKVQTRLVQFNEPRITVRAAMLAADFDVTQAWIILLVSRDSSKKEVALDDVIDLSAPGIEKLRLVPRDINNGEGALSPRREFALLESDEKSLEEGHMHWETVRENGLQWLLIHRYPVPVGYSLAEVTLALQLPVNYPGAQIDMFYVYPPLGLAAGGSPPATEATVEIGGRQFQRWSRHRAGQTQWRLESDNVFTHLVLVEECLVREVEVQP